MVKNLRKRLQNSSLSTKLLKTYWFIFGYPWVSCHIRGRIIEKERSYLCSPAIDIGCGPGVLSKKLASNMGLVIGIDTDIGILKRANKRIGKKVTFVAADARFLPLRDASMNTAVCMELIEHVKEDTQVIEEIARVLCEDGSLLLTTPTPSFHPLHTLLGEITHVREGYTMDQLRDLLKGYFKMVKLTTYLKFYGKTAVMIQSLLFRQGLSGAHPISLIVFPILKFFSYFDHFVRNSGLELVCFARKRVRRSQVYR